MKKARLYIDVIYEGDQDIVLDSLYGALAASLDQIKAAVSDKATVKVVEYGVTHESGKLSETIHEV
jgi:hypothetical protein